MKEEFLSGKQNAELAYAIEEMKIALDLLDNKDLTNRDNSKKMMQFSTISLKRIQDLEINSEHVEWLKRAGDEVLEVSYSINRILNALKNIQAVFDNDNETDINKENVIETFKIVLKQEREAGLLNNITIKSAIDILNNYASKI